ncbi:MAG: exodeoxyribonuclease VII large subunit, partial [Candidatus Woesearchaeota archaeon]
MKLNNKKNNHISVSQFNQYLKRVIDAESFLKNISIVGEISQYNIVRGIAYFVVKDKYSILNCVLFGADKFGQFKIGDKVIVEGSVDYYIKGGKLNFKASNIKKYGVGDIYKEFLELKNRLKKEGLFDESKKKQIPRFPKRIGVVTSRTG